MVQHSEKNDDGCYEKGWTRNGSAATSSSIHQRLDRPSSGQNGKHSNDVRRQPLRRGSASDAQAYPTQDFQSTGKTQSRETSLQVTSEAFDPRPSGRHETGPPHSSRSPTLHAIREDVNLHQPAMIFVGGVSAPQRQLQVLQNQYGFNGDAGHSEGRATSYNAMSHQTSLDARQGSAGSENSHSKKSRKRRGKKRERSPRSWSEIEVAGDREYDEERTTDYVRDQRENCGHTGVRRDNASVFQQVALAMPNAPPVQEPPPLEYPTSIDQNSCVVQYHNSGYPPWYGP